MGAAADLGRKGQRMLRDRGTEVTIPRSSPCAACPAFHEPSATAGREMTGRTGLAVGPRAIGAAFAPAVSMIFGQAKTARTASRPSSSQQSAG